jgi:hypothetical protein
MEVLSSDRQIQPELAVKSGHYPRVGCARSEHREHWVTRNEPDDKEHSHRDGKSQNDDAEEPFDEVSGHPHSPVMLASELCGGQVIKPAYG